MNSLRVLALLGLMVAASHSGPVPDNDLFAGFLRNAQLSSPPKEGDTVKRTIFESNPDRSLKQISFSSLVGDLEKSLFASAASVHGVIQQGSSAEVPEVTPSASGEEVLKGIHKRQLTTVAVPQPAPTSAPEGHKLILQTTEKVPEGSGVPAHIVIDRISIQPHTGGVPLIPAFEIKHTSSGDRAPEITKISISKTEISAVPNTPAPSSTAAPETTSSHDKEHESTISGSSTSTTITPDTTTGDSTTATTKNKEHLKEVEEELKEKVAEIEAEPVILSARV